VAVTGSGKIQFKPNSLTTSRTGVSDGAGTQTIGTALTGGAAAIEKVGTGTTILSGANSYSGNTNINAGTLVLGASNVLPDASAVSLGGATLETGATTSEGAGTLDATGASTLKFGAGSTLAFADSSAIDWTGGTITITGSFVSGSSLRFGTTSGGLTATQLGKISATGFSGFALDSNGYLTATSTGGYASWKTANAPSGGAADDFDGDGVPNGVECVLGGTKDSNDLGLLPEPATDGTYMTFTFERAQASIGADTAVAIEVGTSLGGWPQVYPVPTAATTATPPGVSVVKDSPVAGKDTITLTVPMVPDAAKFARLRVTVTP
jgi:autotransporter-associated beta strand protein